MTTIAWLGTGLMGSGFIEAALKRGDVVRVWNRSPERAKPLEKLGARVFSDVTEAVKGAERIHLSLSNDAAVEDVIAKIPNGDVVIVDHTTVSPRGAAERALHHAMLLHAPVFMAPDNARSSTGVMLCSGQPALFARVESALKAMASEVWYLGGRADKASAFKLFGNAMIVTITAGLSDVLAMATSQGIDPQEALSLFEHFNPARTISIRGARMAKGDYKASFELSMARKDVGLMLDAGGAQMQVLRGIARNMDDLMARGLGGKDLGALAFDVVKER